MFLIRIFVAVAILGLPSMQVGAVPTLTFINGAVTYDSGSGDLTAKATLDDYLDLSLDPVLAGSSLSLGAHLKSVDASDPLYTQALFDSVPGNDLYVEGGDGAVLLTAELDSLIMKGQNGRDFGTVKGTFSATGGLLADLFGPGYLIAMEFSLGPLSSSPIFSADMFDSDFAGGIKGRLEGTPVPEPGPLGLLGAGILLIGTMHRRSRGNNALKRGAM